MIMEERMTIRQAAPSDPLVIAKVIKKAYATIARRYGLTLENCPKHPSNCSVEWIEKDVERGVQYYVIDSGAGIVGCVALEASAPKTCYLERLAVVPEHRNRGLGRRLVDHFLREAESRGFEKAGIGIIAKQRDLKAWYQTFGFVETGRTLFPHLPFEVCVMALRLNRRPAQS